MVQTIMVQTMLKNGTNTVKTPPVIVWWRIFYVLHLLRP